MTDAEVRDVAARTAAALNLPWDAATASVAGPLFGWLSGISWVTSTIASDGATATIAVTRRTGQAWPVRVRYTAGPRPLDRPFLWRRVAFGVAAGIAAYLAAHHGAGIPVLPAVSVALLWAVIGAVFSARAERIDNAPPHTRRPGANGQS